MKEITSYAAYEQMLVGPEPVIVMYTQSCCAPCRPVKKILSELAEKHEVTLHIVNVDAFDMEKLPWLRSTPTVVLFAKGQRLKTRQAAGAEVYEKLFALAVDLARA